MWRYDERRLEMRALEGGQYVERWENRALPGVTLDGVARLIEESKATRRVAWLARVRAWARQLGHEPHA